MEGVVNRKLIDVLDLLLLTSFSGVKFVDFQGILLSPATVEGLVVDDDDEEEAAGFDVRVFAITEIEDPARNISLLFPPREK